MSAMNKLPFSIVGNGSHWYPTPLTRNPPVGRDLNGDLILAIKNFITQCALTLQSTSSSSTSTSSTSNKRIKK
jgi:hypothetical protein